MRLMGVASTSISDTVVCLASQPMAHVIAGAVTTGELTGHATQRKVNCSTEHSKLQGH